MVWAFVVSLYSFFFFLARFVIAPLAGHLWDIFFFFFFLSWKLKAYDHMVPRPCSVSEVWSFSTDCCLCFEWVLTLREFSWCFNKLLFNFFFIHRHCCRLNPTTLLLHSSLEPIQRWMRTQCFPWILNEPHPLSIWLIFSANAVHRHNASDNHVLQQSDDNVNGVNYISLLCEAPAVTLTQC